MVERLDRILNIRKHIKRAVGWHAGNAVNVVQRIDDKLPLSGISVFNFGEGIVRRLHQKDPCVLLDNCSSHYNEGGYKLLAQLAYEHLSDKQFKRKIESRIKVK